MVENKRTDCCSEILKKIFLLLSLMFNDYQLLLFFRQSIAPVRKVTRSTVDDGLSKEIRKSFCSTLGNIFCPNFFVFLHLNLLNSLYDYTYYILSFYSLLLHNY